MIKRTRIYPIKNKVYEVKEYWDGEIVITIEGQAKPLDKSSDEYINIAVYYCLKENNSITEMLNYLLRKRPY